MIFEDQIYLQNGRSEKIITIILKMYFAISDSNGKYL